MSARGTRAIVLNDDDPTIHYEGPWTLLETSEGSFGTVHQLLSSSGTASLSVNFTGIFVIGSAITVHGNDTVGTVVNHPVLYTVNCLLDGESVSNTSISEATTLNTALCNTTETLSAGTVHTLEVTLEFPSPSPEFSFYFDYLLVTPAQNQTISSVESVVLYAEDPVIETSIGEADVGWINQGSWFQTSVPGSQFTFDFTGVSVTWYGKIPQHTQLANSTATYTIDGGDPFPFEMVQNSQLADQPELFLSKQYHYGDHTLHVVYQGNNGSIPLTLSGILIHRVATIDSAGVPQTGTNTALPSLSATSTGTAVSSSFTSAQRQHQGVDVAHLGGILGGVISFFLVVIVFVVYFLVFRRRAMRVHTTSINLASPSENFDGSELVPDPFPFLAAMERRARTDKSAATNSTHRMTSPHGMEELPRTTSQSRPSVQTSPGAQATISRMGYDGGERGSEYRQALHGAQEEDNIETQVMQRGSGQVFSSALPPSYTVQ